MAAHVRNGSAMTQKRTKMATAATSALSSRRRRILARSARAVVDMEGRAAVSDRPLCAITGSIRSAGGGLASVVLGKRQDRPDVRLVDHRRSRQRGQAAA